MRFSNTLKENDKGNILRMEINQHLFSAKNRTNSAGKKGLFQLG